MNNFEKIEAYTAGWMSEQERAAFELELQTDSVLKQDYADWIETDRLLKKNLTATEDLDQLQQILSPLTRQHFNANAQKPGKLVSLKKVWIAAAAIAACLVLYFSLPSGIGDYPVPQMSQALVRGGEDSSNQGAQHFNEGHYEKALPLLEARARSGPDDAGAQFFYAVSLVQTRHYEKALAVLDPLTRGRSVYQEDAAFFAALSAYHLERSQVAIQYADQVGASSLYYKTAQKIIARLR